MGLIRGWSALVSPGLFRLRSIGRFSPWERICCGLFVAALLSACSSAPYRYEPLSDSRFMAEATGFSSAGIEARAAVPGADEAAALLGIDIYDRGIQPVWIEVTNRNDTRARIVISSVDPKYFPPAEVAWFFKKQFSKAGWIDLEARLIDLSLPRLVEPGETVSGFVFTHAEPGTKAFNLDVFNGRLPPGYEQFTFFLRVPGFTPDYANVRFQTLYDDDKLIRTDAASLPATLNALDCCTRNEAGELSGRPVNIYLVAEPLVLLRSLLRAGWMESAVDDNETIAGATHSLFGRPADGRFRKPRDGDIDRSELAIWKTPVTVDGVTLWAAQLRHAIGRRFPLGDRLFGVRVDPDTSEGRDYVLQTFWYAQTLERWGFSPTNINVPQDDPALDFADDPWFTRDANDLVLWLSPDPVPMNEATRQRWDGTPSSTAIGSAK